MRFKGILGAIMPDNFRSKRSYFTSEIAVACMLYLMVCMKGTFP